MLTLTNYIIGANSRCLAGALDPLCVGVKYVDRSQVEVCVQVTGGCVCVENDKRQYVCVLVTRIDGVCVIVN